VFILMNAASELWSDYAGWQASEVAAPTTYASEQLAIRQGEVLSKGQGQIWIYYLSIDALLFAGALRGVQA